MQEYCEVQIKDYLDARWSDLTLISVTCGGSPTRYSDKE